MKFLLCATLIFIICASLHGQPYEFQWKTTKAEIEKVHHLDVFEIGPLQENLDKYLTKSEGSKFVLYIVDNMKYRNFCDIELFSVMGFYSDSLVFYFLATEEMPYSKDNLDNKCLQRSIFGEDSINKWKPIFKTYSKDGDIFWEGGYCGVGETENEYLVSLTSLGQKGISNPEHLQFANFFFDRDFLDEILQKKMRIHADHKLKLHPTSLFVEYLVDDYKSLQQPVETE